MPPSFLLMEDVLSAFYMIWICFPCIVCWILHVSLPRYATASARSDGLLLLCGGRDASSVVSETSDTVASWMDYYRPRLCVHYLVRFDCGFLYLLSRNNLSVGLRGYIDMIFEKDFRGLFIYSLGGCNRSWLYYSNWFSCACIKIRWDF